MLMWGSSPQIAATCKKPKKGLFALLQHNSHIVVFKDLLLDYLAGNHMTAMYNRQSYTL